MISVRCISVRPETIAKAATVLLFLLAPIPAEAWEPPVAPGTERNASETGGTDGATTAGYLDFSTGFSLATEFLQTFERVLPTLTGDADYRSSIPFNTLYYGTVFSRHLPLYGMDPGAALCFSAANAAAIGGNFLNRSTLGNPWLETISNSLLDVSSLYPTYLIYVNARTNHGSAADTAGFRAWDLGTLACSPFIPEYIIHPAVWIPAICTVAFTFLSMGTDGAVWNSDRVWIGNWETNPAAGLAVKTVGEAVQCTMIAVGEEAFYRGVLYEEFRKGMGGIGAKVTDAILFPAMHIPSEIQAGESWGNIGLMFLVRAGLTVAYDLAYDLGGMPLSVCSHMWVDFAAFMSSWLLSGTSPRSRLY